MLMIKKTLLIATLFVAIIFCLAIFIYNYHTKNSPHNLKKLVILNEILLKPKKIFKLPNEDYFNIINSCILDNAKVKILFSTYRKSNYKNIYSLKTFNLKTCLLKNFPAKQNDIYNYNVSFVYHSFLENKTFVKDIKSIIEIDNNFGVLLKKYKIDKTLVTFCMENKLLCGFSLESHGIIYCKKFTDNENELNENSVFIDNNSELTDKKLRVKVKKVKEKIKNINLAKSMIDTIKAIPKVCYGIYFNKMHYFVKKSNCAISIYKNNRLTPTYSLSDTIGFSVSLIDIKSNENKIMLLASDVNKRYFIIEIKRGFIINLYPLDRTELNNTVATGLIYMANYGYLVLNYNEEKECYSLIQYGN